MSLAKQEEVDGRDYRDSDYAWVHVARFTEKSRFNILWDTNLWGFGCRLSARKPPHYFVYFRTRVMDVACRYTTGSSHHASAAHLKRYVAEFDFCYNERSALGVNDAERATQALKGIVGKRLTYRRTSEARQA